MASNETYDPIEAVLDYEQPEFLLASGGQIEVAAIAIGENQPQVDGNPNPTMPPALSTAPSGTAGQKNRGEAQPASGRITALAQGASSVGEGMNEDKWLRESRSLGQKAITLTGVIAPPDSRGSNPAGQPARSSSDPRQTYTRTDTAQAGAGSERYGSGQYPRRPRSRSRSPWRDNRGDFRRDDRSFRPDRDARDTFGSRRRSPSPSRRERRRSHSRSRSPPFRPAGEGGNAQPARIPDTRERGYGSRFDQIFERAERQPPRGPPLPPPPPRPLGRGVFPRGAEIRQPQGALLPPPPPPPTAHQARSIVNKAVEEGNPFRQALPEVHNIHQSKEVVSGVLASDPETILKSLLAPVLEFAMLKNQVSFPSSDPAASQPPKPAVSATVKPAPEPSFSDKVHAALKKEMYKFFLPAIEKRRAAGEPMEELPTELQAAVIKDGKEFKELEKRITNKLMSKHFPETAAKRHYSRSKDGATIKKFVQKFFTGRAESKRFGNAAGMGMQGAHLATATEDSTLVGATASDDETSPRSS